MSNLPQLEVFLRADPLEAVAVSDPPVNVEQPIFQTVNLDGVLTEDDIGATVQPYDADTVIDADYDALKTKVGTIQEGAQVNPDLSVYAPTNNATFTGSLILPNNSRINGVEHFYQSTKPLARGDGSPLQDGDIWWKVDSGDKWTRKGIYWVSVNTFSIGVGGASTINATANFGGSLLPKGLYYVEFAEIAFQLDVTSTPTNHWVFNLATGTTLFFGELFLHIAINTSTQNGGLSSGILYTFSGNPGVVIQSPYGDQIRPFFRCTRVGTSANGMKASSVIVYRSVYA